MKIIKLEILVGFHIVLINIITIILTYRIYYINFI
jgi:hypothetical protein